MAIPLNDSARDNINVIDPEHYYSN
jgi:hypothetical protein